MHLTSRILADKRQNSQNRNLKSLESLILLSLYQISCLLVKKKTEIIGRFAHSPQNSAKMLDPDKKSPLAPSDPLSSL